MVLRCCSVEVLQSKGGAAVLRCCGVAVKTKAGKQKTKE
jgi:hypothetical protein